MSATAVSISSNALLRLGSHPINSFDEGDPEGSNVSFARLASNLWPSVRRQVLRGHIWNCATRRVLLSPETTPPAFGWANQFLKPSDWLRTVAVGAEGERIDYVMEDRYFLANESALPLLYIFDNTNPATYDAGLVAALEIGMMAALAYPVTKSTSLAAELSQLLRDTLAQARAWDGQDDPAQTLGDFPLMRSRFGARIARG